jgi:thiol:disulfide interchange protein DsbD
MMKTVSCILFLLQVVTAQISIPLRETPFHWSASMQAAESGRPAKVRVKLTIAEKYYVYASKTSVRLEGPAGCSFGEPLYSPSVKHADNISGKTEAVYFDSLTVLAEVGAAGVAGDSVKILALCSYQGCTSTMCFLPATDSVFLNVAQENLPRTRRPGGQSAPSAGPGSQSQGPLAGKGMLALFFAFLGGLLTCLTPCVYPLIPVTLGVFGASAAKSKPKAFGLSCVYVGGICVMFSTLGFVVASSGKVFGQFLANPWIVAVIAAAFCVFGVSLFGAFDFQMPSFVQNRLAAFGGRRAGIQKVFLMGLVAGIIAAPCTGPTLGAILTYVAAAGNQAFGILMLVSFSLGLGVPFLLLGTFAGLVAARPKPGPWMESVKASLGIIMFDMALYFLRSIFPGINGLLGSSPLYFILAAACVAGGIALGGLNISFHGASTLRIARKIAGIILMIGGSFGIAGSAFFGPTHGPANSEAASAGVHWETDLDKGLTEARDRKKPAVIDFYADWCIACKELDKTVFSDPAVRAELSRFVCIRQDLTIENDRTKRTARDYGLRGIPVIELYATSGERLLGERIVGAVSAERFLAVLQKIH